MNRRWFHRKAYSMRVVYFIHGQAYEDVIRNISGGGVYIQSDENFSEGDPIALSFELPISQMIFKFKGNIAWAGPDGFGVRFVG